MPPSRPESVKMLEGEAGEADDPAAIPPNLR